MRSRLLVFDRLPAACALALTLGLAAPAWAMPPDLGRAVDGGHAAAAEAKLRAWLRQHPYDAEAHCTLARALHLEGRDREALAEYDHLLALAPDDPDGLLGKGQVLLVMGQAGAAVPLLERARAVEPGNREIWRTLGEAYAQAGMAAQASATKRATHRRFPLADAPASGHDAIALEGQAAYLTGGNAPWTSETLSWQHQFVQPAQIRASLKLTNRFSTEDATLGLIFGEMVAKRLVLGVSGDYSPTHQVVPTWDVQAYSHVALGTDWVLGLDLWPEQDAGNLAIRESAWLERRFGGFSVAYAPAAVQLGGIQAGLAHRLVLKYLQGSTDVVTLAGAIGPAYAFAGPQQVIAVSERSVSLRGLHWFNTIWGLTYGAAWTEEGALYTTTGVRLGVMRRF